jgi:membrane-anchored glycerophosphoryl diester phosphodiesterase (GDPDase)
VSSRLSISAAWDRAKARFASDGSLLLTVALALIALPSALAEFAFPQRNPFAGIGSAGEAIAMLVVAVLGIVGQLALVRLALGPSISVGEAIAHGARRSLYFLGSALIFLVGLLILAIPFGALMLALGVPMTGGVPAADGRAALVVLAFVVAIVFLSTRLILSAPVASMEAAGPIAILRRSWQLTSGHFWRLFGFVILFLIGALAVTAAAGIMVQLVVVGLFGPLEPLTAGALVVALILALVTAGITALFIVIAAQIFAQLAAPEAARASVPSSGT